MKVSVIIPTYNRAHYIGFALDSVLEQHVTNMEIIVVDDGSTDNTRELLQEKYFGKINYIQQENRGFGAARNRGIEAASGKYIAFIDSDDLWCNGKLDLQISIMDDYPEIGFLFTDFSIMKESGERIDSGLQTWFDTTLNWDSILPCHTVYAYKPTNVSGQNHYSIRFGNLYRSLLANPYILPSTAIVRRSSITSGIEHTEGDPIYADWNFFALLSQKGSTACFLDHETVINRSHSDDVRATSMVKLLEKLQYRLASLDIIWKSDPSFMQNHGDDVNKVESDLLLKLATQSFRLHRSEDSLRYLNTWQKTNHLSTAKKAMLLMLMTKIPGSSRIFAMLR